MSLAPRLESLADIDAALWRELARAPLDRHHEWRTPVLATVDANGDGADARVVVLRETDAQARELRLFTDARSAKVAQLASHPQGTLVMWSKRLSWQLRLRVALHVQTEGAEVAARWARVSQSPAAGDYLSTQAPGSPLSQAPAPDQGSTPSHFALLVATVLCIDWLELNANGHRRAAFDAAGGRWLVP